MKKQKDETKGMKRDGKIGKRNNGNGNGNGNGSAYSEEFK